MNKRVVEKLAKIANEAEHLEQEYQADSWTIRTRQFLETALGADAAKQFDSLISDWWPGAVALRRGYLEALLALEEIPDEEGGGSVVERAALGARSKRLNSRKVFVVHGHNEAAKNAVALFLQRVGLEPIILHEQASAGRTVIEKVEVYSADIAFAVVLLTPDDVGSEASDASHLKPRARQNVILELGFFIGKLSRTRVCALFQGNIELPSDYQGVVYVEMDAAGAWKTKLAQELVESRITIKLEELLKA